MSGVAERLQIRLQPVNLWPGFWQGSGKDQAAPEGVNPRPTIKVLLRLLTVPLLAPTPVKTCHLNKQPKDRKLLCSLEAAQSDSGVLSTAPTKRMHSTKGRLTIPEKNPKHLK